MKKLVNAKEILQKAHKNGYAVPHININNLEWVKVILTTCQKMNSPVILGISEGALKYMGGVKTVFNLVTNLMNFLKITIPVVLHVDHGTVETCLAAIKTGFTSVMYDGSHESFEVNLKNTKKVIAAASKKDVSVEAEVGSIGGEEDGVIGLGEIASEEEALKMKEAGVTMLAAGIGNIHGLYPPNWKSLDFDTLKNLSFVTQLPLVLHGGSGIPTDQIQEAIKLGISKININTELQLANAKGITEFIVSGEVKKGKNYDPRKMYAPGIKLMEETIEMKILEFGSKDKA
ncbi:class II fructose-1,6-bisphosphate aldolase [Mesomycoplasma hyorhinis]|uniref:class II fructose-1,6-bisphosphate aldolase n=1 Tax=Mesomycoplasma hyorhinis TaxID=2100 RepID=UPI001C04D472|nr:class II fructose-1,6-bisphosphate aldolase [Mesomycoplasma hyorhinis]